MSQSIAFRKLFAAHDGRVSFSEQSEPVPGDLRLAWRLAVLCLILDRCHGGKMNLPGLHVLWWAIRTPRSRRLFMRWLRGKQDPDDLLVRFDPGLTATADLGLGSGLVAMDSNANVKLLPEGQKLASEVWAVDGVLLAEKEFLDLFGGKITQKLINNLLEWR